MSELLKSIHGKLTKQLERTGRVILDARLFGAPQPLLEDLFERYFHGTNRQLRIGKVEGYQYDEVEGAIVFKGTGQGGAFDGMTIEQVLITVDETRPGKPVPQIAVDAAPPAGWGLPNLIPELGTPAVTSLKFHDAELFWASYTSEVDQTVEGFYVQAAMDLSGPFGVLAAFVDADAPPMLSGQIGVTKVASADGLTVQYLPDALLQADAKSGDVSPDPANKDRLTLSSTQLQLSLSATFNEVDGRWQVRDRMLLKGWMAFKGLWFLCEADVHDPASDILFSVTTDMDIVGAFEELVAWVGPELAVPGLKINDPGSIRLKDLKLAYNPGATGSKITFVCVHVGTAKGEKWPLWSGVELEDIELTFFVRPGQGVELDVAGTVAEWLRLGGAFSSTGDYSFTATEVGPTPLKKVYALFAGEPRDDLPDLDIDRVFASIAVRQKLPPSFEGDIELDGVWRIVDSPVPIELRGLIFKVQHNNGGPAAPAGVNDSVLAGATLAVGDYVFGVQAAHSTVDGWDFAGALDIDDAENHNIATFGKSVDTLFATPSGGPSLPGALLDWYIPHVAARFKTQSKAFGFDCSLENPDFPGLDLTFSFQLDPGPASYTRTVTGVAQYVHEPFDLTLRLEFDEAQVVGPPPSTTSTINLDYTASRRPPALSDFLLAVAARLGVDGGLPEALALDAALTGLAAEIRKKDQDPVIVEAAADFAIKVKDSEWELYLAYTNDATLAGQPALQANGQRAFVLGVALAGAIDLSRLPVVGKIPGIRALRIDKLGFYYTNAQFQAPGVPLTFEVPALASKHQLAAAGAEATLEKKGFSLVAVFGDGNPGGAGPSRGLGGWSLPLQTGPLPRSPGFASQPVVPQAPIAWLDVGRTFGPVELQKVGIGYEKARDPTTSMGDIGFYVAGALKIGGLAMTLDGLGVSFAIPKPGASFNPLDDIGFHLGGMSIDYKAPDLEIAGGLVSLPGGKANFIGQLTVRAGGFGLQAYGGFSDELESPSLFVFVHLEAPLGGPPFFFVEGLSGGFGINRSFRLPSFAELPSYPLLPSNPTIPTASSLTGDPQTQLQTMTVALAKLATYLPPTAGEYWLAVGLDVSCFKMITASAVLSVAFGVELQIGVVGSASMSFPVAESDTRVPPLAYVRVDFEVSYSSRTGLLAAFGQLTPESYVLGPFVQITGGFAFLVWLDGEHKGDFLFSIGGYHPRFHKPDRYPAVPRLGIRYGIDSLHAGGDAYFAMTPGLMMAGMAIAAVWALGPIEAAFDAGLDFLINWKPFAYLANGYVHVAISLVLNLGLFKLRISFHVGIDLEVWGPKLGGRATIDLDIVSFTISFGDPLMKSEVAWADVQQMLPSVHGAGPPTPKPAGARTPVPAAAPADSASKPANATIAVSGGLLRSYSEQDRVDGLDWLVDAERFEITTSTSIPCSNARITRGEDPGDQQPIRLVPVDLRRDVTYVDPDGSRIRGDIRERITSGGQYPFFAHRRAEYGSDWNDLAFGVVPMNVPSVETVHTITILRDGEPVNDLVYTLVTGSVPAAFWGTGGSEQANRSLGADQLIRNALVGFRVTPAFFFPARTSFIELYYLVFDVNDLFLARADAPEVRAAAFDADEVATIEANMASGALFGDERAGPFSGTAAVRRTIVGHLRELGFDRLATSNDAKLRTVDYLDEPILCCASDTTENHFGGSAAKATSRR